MMTHEDLLRELELLPVWQQRHSVAEAKLSETEQSPLIVQAADNHQSEIETEAETKQSAILRIIVSDDGEWMFALSQQHSAEAETLFHNMLKAVNVNIGQQISDAQMTTIFSHKTKIIVAMGEGVAQQLLALTQPLMQLRGRPHFINNIPVIVTYAPDDLLQNLADKAGAWEDLCLAKITVANL